MRIDVKINLRIPKWIIKFSSPFRNQWRCFSVKCNLWFNYNNISREFSSMTTSFLRFRKIAFRVMKKSVFGRLLLSNLLVALGRSRFSGTFIFRGFRHTIKADAANRERRGNRLRYRKKGAKKKRYDPGEIISCVPAKLEYPRRCILARGFRPPSSLLYISNLAGRALRIAPFPENINHGRSSSCLLESSKKMMAPMIGRYVS